MGYTTRQPLPHLLEIGLDADLVCPVYLDGALVAPSAGTVSVYDDLEVAVVDAAAVTITGDVASYTAAGPLTSNRSPSGGWRIVWTLTVDGDTVVFRDEAYVVRYRLRPVIADLDVAQRLPYLSTSHDGRPTIAASYQGAIDEADIQVQSRLIELGRRPWLVVSPSALRETWLALTIATIFDGLSAASGAGIDDPYAGQAAAWRQRYEDAFGRARMAFDWDEDGVADAGTRTGPRPGGLWLC